MNVLIICVVAGIVMWVCFAGLLAVIVGRTIRARDRQRPRYRRDR